MATDFEEVSSDAGAEFSTRIDELLSSAIQEQSRDQRMLIDALRGAQAEIKRMRDLIESRQENVGDILEARLSGIATDESVQKVLEGVEKRLDESRDLLERVDPWKPAMEIQRALGQKLSESISSIKENIEAATSSLSVSLSDSTSELKESVQRSDARNFDRLVQIQEDLTSLAAAHQNIPDQLKARIEEIRGESRSAAAASSRQIEQIVDKVGAKLDDDLAEGQAALAAMSRQIEDFRDSLEEQVPRLSERVGNAVAPFTEELRELAVRVRRSNMKTSELSTRLEAMSQSLVAYLAQRDERIERTRDRVLADLVEGLGHNLNRRDRVRVTNALKKASRARKDRRDAEKYRKMSAAASPSQAPSVLESPLEASPEPTSAPDKIEAPKPRPPARRRTLKAKPVSRAASGSSKGRQKPTV